MLIFEKIKFKNLLSFGNMWSVIDFSSNSSLLIQGINGSGKSAAILDSLTFVLYGKPFRKVNKSQLVNYKNKKEMIVEVWFSNDKGEKYHIIRGLNPSVFEIYKDNDQTLINQDASVRDYQEYLEKYVLKMDYQTFTQIVILGKATYIAFLQMSLNDRRKFIENILNLRIFGSMNDVTKVRITDTKNNLVQNKNDLNLIKNKIDMLEKHIQDFEQETLRQQMEHEKLIDEQIENNNNDIKSLEKEIEEKRSGLLEINDNLESLNLKLETCYDLQSKMSSKLKEIKKRIKFFSDNDTCPTCENVMDTSIKELKKTQFFKKEQEIILAQSHLEDKTRSVLDYVQSIQKKITINREIEQSIKILEDSIKQKLILISSLEKNRMIKINLAENKIQEYKNNLNEFIAQREIKNDERNEINTQLECYDFISTMLKDSGIKSSIIKTYIPKIVSLMNYYLRALGIFVKFELNENFEETLLGRGIDQLSYNSYSEGEKLRINLAMLLTWRDIAKHQNNFSTNFIIFDEILDASLDEIGSENLINLFKDISKNGIKVIVVSHSIEKWESGFNEVLIVEKNSGFSTISRHKS